MISSMMYRPTFKAPDVKIVAGRRKVIWKDWESSLQPAFRPPLQRTILPLKSNIVLDDFGTGSARSSVCFSEPGALEATRGLRRPSDRQDSLPDDPQRVPFSRLVAGNDRTSADNTAQALNRRMSGVTTTTSVEDLSARFHHHLHLEEPSEMEADKSSVGWTEYDRMSPEINDRGRMTRASSIGHLSSTHHQGESSAVTRRRALSILPPIQQSAKSRSSRKLTELEEITLRNTLNKHSSLIEEDKMRQVLSSLRIQDEYNTGKLLPQHVLRTLNNLEISFSPDIDEALLLKFEDRHGLIHYEKLIEYLLSIKLHTRRMSEHRLTPVQAHRKRSMPRRGAAFTSRDLSQMIAELTDYMRMHVVDRHTLISALYDQDRDRDGCLNAVQLKAALRRLNMEDMPDSLFVCLCAATEHADSGLYEVAKIIKHLEKARPMIDGASIPGIGTNHRPRAPKQPTALTSSGGYEKQSLTGHSQTIGGEMSAGTSTVAGSSSAWYKRRASVPQSAVTNSKWSQDFGKLCDALYDLDKDGSGFIDEQDASRLTETYNTIYDLQLSQNLVERSLASSTDQRYKLIDIGKFTSLIKHQLLK